MLTGTQPAAISFASAHVPDGSRYGVWRHWYCSSLLELGFKLCREFYKQCKIIGEADVRFKTFSLRIRGFEVFLKGYGVRLARIEVSAARRGPQHGAFALGLDDVDLFCEWYREALAYLNTVVEGGVKVLRNVHPNLLETDPRAAFNVISRLKLLRCHGKVEGILQSLHSWQNELSITVGVKADLLAERDAALVAPPSQGDHTLQEESGIGRLFAIARAGSHPETVRVSPMSVKPHQVLKGLGGINGAEELLYGSDLRYNTNCVVQYKYFDGGNPPHSHVHRSV